MANDAPGQPSKLRDIDEDSFVADHSRRGLARIFGAVAAPAP